MTPETNATESESEGVSAAAPGASFRLAALGLALLHLLCGLLVFEPTLFPGGDNAAYLILADALRSGEGYRDLYLPGAPLHTRYPPVLPVLLSGLGWIGGVGLAKIAMLAITSSAVWVTAHFGRRWVGSAPALMAAGLLALNPTLLEYGHYILSEAPFVLLILLALWASERDELRGALLAMAAAVGAFSTRTAGMTILAALPVAWLLAGRLRRAAWAGATAAGALATWAIYQRWAASDQPGYLTELLLLDPYNPTAGGVGWSGLIVRAAENCWAYVSRVVPQTILGAEGQAGLVLGFIGLAVAGFAVAGWVTQARRRPRAPEVFVVLYAGLIAFWPSVWTDRRFLLPLAPLVLLLAAGFASQFAEPRRRWVQIAMVCLVLTPCFGWMARTVPDRIACAASYRTGRPCDPPGNASFYEAARWVRENTAQDVIVANRKPRLFYWYSRRAGDVYPFSPDPQSVMDGLDRMGAGYVVVDQISATTARFLIPAIRANQGRFEPVYQGGTPPTVVFRILALPATAE